MAHFIDEVQLPQGKSHFKEAVYVLPLRSHKFLVLILSTSEEWKGWVKEREVTLANKSVQLKSFQSCCILNTWTIIPH